MALHQGQQFGIGEGLVAAGQQQDAVLHRTGGAGQGRGTGVGQLQAIEFRLGRGAAPEQQGRAHQDEDQDQQQVSPVALEHGHLNV
ncbi:hypothetical protein D3C72_2304980 [compost metagenome]